MDGRPRSHEQVPSLPVEDVIGSLRATFEAGSTTELRWREQQLEALSTLLRERHGELVEAVVADMGRPRVEAWLTDVVPPGVEAEHARRHLRAWARPRRARLPVHVLPGSAWSFPRPKGVVLIVGPWNYPVQLTLSPLVGALAAGNAVVIKPSELAPATSAVLARLLPEYVDPAAVAVVEGGADVTHEIIGAGVDHVFFTGGSAAGRAVAVAAADRLIPVTLELGGKSPTVICRDADLDVAARRVAWGKLVNGGQTCIAPDYVLVDRAVADAFTDKLVRHLRTAPASTPVVNDHHLERLLGLLGSHGGTTLTGGAVDRDRRVVSPTVILDPDRSSPLMREEIFGPILPVLTTDGLHDAVRFIQSRPNPLAAYVFTKSKDVQRTFAQQVQAGSVGINHVLYQVLVPDLPFGGSGASGSGAYHGVHGFRTFSQQTAVHRRPTRPDLGLFYPPYTKVKERIFRALLP
jgi:aldehyde dehydrogenase (NAD+)